MLFGVSAASSGAKDIAAMLVMTHIDPQMREAGDVAWPTSPFELGKAIAAYSKGGDAALKRKRDDENAGGVLSFAP